MDSAVLTDLLARVEGATGADRELDEQLAVRLAGFKPTVLIGHEILGNLRHVPAHSPTYTASLDSALALVARVLPGWELELTSEHRDHAVIWRVGLGDPLRGHGGEGPTPALALLAATLTALLSQEPRHG